jgi:transposase
MPKPVKSERNEVVASPQNDRPQRRRFTAEQKARIVAEADACERGELAALLRREGLYHTQLSEWRAQLKNDGLNGLRTVKPGPKGKDERDRVIEKQRKHIARLEKEARISQALIDLQLKAHEILGIALPRVEDKEMADLQESSNSALRRSR